VPACEQSPQSWPRSGISRRRGNPTRPAASRHMLAACARVGVSWRRILCRHMVPPMTLEERRHACGLGRRCQFDSTFKIFVSKYQNQEIGEDSQGRYAPMHLPDHVAYAMDSAPKVRRRFPSRSLKPLPTHPRLRPDSHADELEKADRSQRSAFIFWVPLLGATTLGRGRRELRNHESDLPGAQLWVRGLHDAREGSWASDYLGLIFLCVGNRLVLEDGAGG